MGTPGCRDVRQQAEDAALASMRDMLPAMYKRAGFEAQDLILWGVPLEIHLQHSNAQKGTLAAVLHQQAALRKFLRAESLDASAAAARLLETLEWRKTSNVTKLANQRFSNLYDAAGCVHGFDRYGSPVIYENVHAVAELVARFGAQDVVWWAVHQLERAMASVEWTSATSTVTHVIEYMGRAVRRSAHATTAQLEIERLVTRHYPDCIGMRLLLRPPPLKRLASLCCSARCTATPTTAAVLPANVRATLLDNIPPEQLLPKYAGFIVPPSNTLWCTDSSIRVPAGQVISLKHVAPKRQPLQYQFVTRSGSIRVSVDDVMLDAEHGMLCVAASDVATEHKISLDNRPVLGRDGKRVATFSVDRHVFIAISTAAVPTHNGESPKSKSVSDGESGGKR